MRRVLGAGVLIVGLGASDLLYLLVHSHRPRPDPAATSTVPTDPAAGAPPSVTRAGRATPTVPPSFASDPFAFLSTAPADSLDLLPGVGPVLAMRIVEARRGQGSFTSWDDVLHVRGIGPGTIQKWQALASRR
jgi:DNA uptake protein ComE-like DNA-binding protein